MSQLLQRFLRSATTSIALLVIVIYPVSAEWSLFPGVLVNSPEGLAASSSLLRMSDSTLVLITLDQAEPFNSLNFRRFNGEGELINEGSSSLSSLIPESPLHATELGDNTFALTITVSVTPPTGNGRDILLRTFNLDFEQVGSQLIVAPGQDSVSAIQAVSQDRVAITGMLNGPTGHAFSLEMNVDGLVQWVWQDDVGEGESSSGLDLAKVSVPGNLVVLVRKDTPLEQTAHLLTIDNGDVVDAHSDPLSHFPYRRGQLVLSGLYRLYYTGFDPMPGGSGYTYGSYDYDQFSGWEEQVEDVEGELVSFCPDGSGLLITSDTSAQSWSHYYAQPQGEEVPFEVGGKAVVRTSSESVILLGSAITRVGLLSGETFYTRVLENEAVAGVRLDDTTFVALQREETSPGNYTHTLQWYSEHFVNRPPETPHPLEPANGEMIDLVDDPGRSLRWRVPHDPDPESEVATELILQVDRFERPDTLYMVSSLEDTSYAISRLGGQCGVPIEQVQGALWRLRFISDGDTVEMDEPWSFALQAASVDEASLPGAFSLDLYPNPFNSTVQVRFSLASRADLYFSLFNLLGREVLALPLTSYSPGIHNLSLNPGLTSGVYLLSVRDQEGKYLASRRAILIQ